MLCYGDTHVQYPNIHPNIEYPDDSQCNDCMISCDLYDSHMTRSVTLSSYSPAMNCTGLCKKISAKFREKFCPATGHFFMHNSVIYQYTIYLLDIFVISRVTYITYDSYSSEYVMVSHINHNKSW